MKATYVEINGEGREIFKDPITDSGTKKSAKGRLAVLKDANTGDFILKDQLSAEELESLEDLNWLRTVYLDGKFVNPLSWQDVKANAGR
jgi:nicotinamide phosphoribosyltransferase